LQDENEIKTSPQLNDNVASQILLPEIDLFQPTFQRDLIQFKNNMGPSSDDDETSSKELKDQESGVSKNANTSFNDPDKNTNSQMKYGKDLAEHIPNLYRLLELYKDDSTNGLGKFIL